MLVLSRKVNENIIIDGRIVVKVVRTEGNQVKLGIEAPVSVSVHRQEIYEEIQKNNRAALRVQRPANVLATVLKPETQTAQNTKLEPGSTPSNSC